MKVRWLRYWRHDRQPWVVSLFSVVLACGFYAMARRWTGDVLLAAGATVFLTHVRYVRRRFAGGMLCAGVTLTTKPMLVAMLTDLGSGWGGSRPVVKVFAAPPSMEELLPGTRVAAVTLYSGQTGALHWNDCHPVLARAADDSTETEASLLSRIPEEEWAELSSAVEKLRRPFKSGLFSIQLLQES